MLKNKFRNMTNNFVKFINIDLNSRKINDEIMNRFKIENLKVK